MNVVVAMMDGSEYGRWALNWVAKMPLVEPPRVTVVHVMDTTTLRAPFLPLPVVASGKAYVQEEIERMEVRSAQLISDVKQQLAALKLKGTVQKEEGAVAPEILKHAPKQDGLLVVGSKGVDTLHRFMLGSVSTNLLSYATMSCAGRQAGCGTITANHLGDRWVGRIGESPRVCADQVTAGSFDRQEGTRTHSCERDSCRAVQLEPGTDGGRPPIGREERTKTA